MEELLNWLAAEADGLINEQNNSDINNFKREGMMLAIEAMQGKIESMSSTEEASVESEALEATEGSTEEI